MKNERKITVYLTKVAILSALAFVIMMFEFPLPFIPAFLTIDLSEVPVLLGSFALGPLSAVLIELIKNVIHLSVTKTYGIGELANFLVGISFAVPAGLIYRKMKNKKGAVLSLSVGTLTMVAFASVLNYYVLVPLYGLVLKFPVEAIVGIGAEANKNITNLRMFIAYGIVPFNLIKGVVVSFVVILVYKKLSPLLHRN